MECGGCTKSVTSALQTVEPGAHVDVDLATKLVAVSAATIQSDRIADAIIAAGYPATPLPAAARTEAAATKPSVRRSRPGLVYSPVAPTGVNSCPCALTGRSCACWQR
ncbi:MAG: copper chaperone [Methylobacterium sp.]|jgi:copper chaperone|uniref:heavy-metal-associated domain-containing protein n=1 Tax=Methylobacterium sp. C1 TaxID=1479019 RepID=UPI0009F4F209|nr:MAG: copper chaperone [Methylobacterium sp.]